MAKRKKATASDFGCLIGFVIIVYVLVLIHETVGWTGILIIGAIITGVYIFWDNAKDNK